MKLTIFSIGLTLLSTFIFILTIIFDGKIKQDKNKKIRLSDEYNNLSVIGKLLIISILLLNFGNIFSVYFDKKQSLSDKEQTANKVYQDSIDNASIIAELKLQTLNDSIVKKTLKESNDSNKVYFSKQLRYLDTIYAANLKLFKNIELNEYIKYYELMKDELRANMIYLDKIKEDDSLPNTIYYNNFDDYYIRYFFANFEFYGNFIFLEYHICLGEVNYTNRNFIESNYNKELGIELAKKLNNLYTIMGILYLNLDSQYYRREQKERNDFTLKKFSDDQIIRCYERLSRQ